MHRRAENRHRETERLTPSVMKATYISFRILAFIFFNCAACSTAATPPMLFAIDDLYEFRDGVVVETRVDSEGVQWKTEVNLEKLDILNNDMVLSLPFESCLEEKFTGRNVYGDHAEQNSKFEEIHKVTRFSYVTLT